MTSTTPDPDAPDVPGEPTGPVDVVAVPSLRADGTPDQTPGFVTLVADEPDES